MEFFSPSMQSAVAHSGIRHFYVRRVRALDRGARASSLHGAASRSDRKDSSMKSVLVWVSCALFVLIDASVAFAGPAAAAGGAHSVVLTDTGTVWTWGANGFGQLGDGTTTTRSTPTWISSITGVVAIAAGGNSTYALKTDGTIWAWGANASGQLGDGTQTTRTSPTAVTGLSNVIAIAAGSAHAIALKGDGTVWAWGSNSYGQLGDGTTTMRTAPVQVTTLGTSAVGISAHGNNSHAIKTDGTLWSWGDNFYSSVGDGTGTNRSTPVQTSNLTSVSKSAGGSGFSYAITSSGAVKAWGYGNDGEMGDGTWFSRTTPVSVSGLTSGLVVAGGDTHAVAAMADGTPRTWGGNQFGQLGDGTTTYRNSPVQPSGPTGLVAVAAGGSHSIAVSSDGRVWMWGFNTSGQLGDGTVDQRKTPTQISDAAFAWRVATPRLSPFGGSSTANMTVTVTDVTAGATIHYTTNGVNPTESDPTVASGGTIAITQTTTLKANAWLSGMPTSNTTTATYTLTVATPTLSPGTGTYTSAQTVTMTSSTSGATIRYTTDGTTPTATSTIYTAPISVTTAMTVKAVGFKTGWSSSGVGSAAYTFNYGTLAAPVFSPPPAQIGYGTTVTLSAASGATIRYTTNGSTPTSSSTIYTGPITVTGTVTIYAKAFHPDWTTSAQSGGTYTVKVSTPVFSPDAGSYAPGQAITVTNATPGAVMHYTTNGATPTASDPVITSGGTVIAGQYTLKAIAMLTGWTSSDVKTAAYTLTGPLTSYAVRTNSTFVAALKSDGTVWTFGSNSGGSLGDSSSGRSTPAMVNGLTGVTAISAGSRHVLALRTDGSVWAWGGNEAGQLGDTTTTDRSTYAAVSGLSSVTAIAAGGSFSVALKSDGSLWTWGSNANGQLGDGTVTQRTTPTHVPGLSAVASIAAGDTHTAVRTTSGAVWTWGANASGQLGDGTTTQRTSPVLVSTITATAGPWAGNAYTVAATADGSVWSWGANDSAQLGLGTVGGVHTAPSQMPTIANIATADGGQASSAAAASDGSVWTWGDNYDGEVGDGTTMTPRTTAYHLAGLSNITSVAAGYFFTVAVTSDGSVWTWGYNNVGQLGDGTVDQRIAPVKISEAGFNWKTSTPRLSYPTGTYSAIFSVVVTAVTSGAEIHYTTNGSDPTQTDPTVVSGGSVSIDQTMTFKAAAWASGMPASNVASAIYTMALPAVTLSPGTGTYVVTQQATTTIRAKAFRSGWTDSAIASGAYTMKVVPPTFSPTSGSYPSPQAIAMSTTTPSSTIRYTTNGSEPTGTSPVYTAPITIGTTSTIKAIASRAGWVDSDSAAASYWFTQGTVATPTFTPGAGSYSGSAFVSITTSTSGATIRYTLDGTDPTLTSARYQWPITIAATTTVKARAYKDSFTPSAVATASFAVDAAGAVDTPLIVPAGGRFTAGVTAVVTVQASGATLRYTTTGVDPTASDPVVPGSGITVDRSMVVKVKAWSGTASPSAVRRADFVITGALAAGGTTTHALKSDGTMWGWGSNGSGQIGNGTTTTQTSPVAVTGLTGTVAMAQGPSHTLAVKADGTVWSWGSNLNYRLGDTSAGRTSPAQVSGLSGIIAVAAGETHTLALKSDGTVWTFGGNGAGQLGDGTTADRAAPAMVPGLSGVSRIAAGRDFSFETRAGAHARERDRDRRRLGFRAGRDRRWQRLGVGS
ncbi:MAG: hypothetical protein DMF99_00940 [Acidobacteria bacterium]|nr:MAG: hypothetical protein DMF99_00940 [Acidobacteriota bacterium]